ncbi:YgeY family selenium metabolism-linked hydrolase [Clostridia bacterium]|nr:YgeY family selenium metabolism-linked hydrolase [Clostridia bacterium]
MENITDITKQISDYIDEHKSEMISFLREFVSIESVTYNEGEAVNWLAKKMEEMGYDEVRIDAIGNIHGRVGHGDKVLLYDAHIDTVETGDASEWGFDPLEGKMDENGDIWGRGAVDDKGPLSAIVWAAKAIKDLGLDDKVTMWVGGSISEEDVEGSCAEEMMKLEEDINPDYIIVSEASDGELKRGHKGRALIKITVPGKCAHGSCAWKGENALIKALPIIKGIDAFDDFKEDPFLGKGSIEVTKVECKTPSLNTIPGEVTIYCDRRISCGESREDLIKELKPVLDLVPDATAAIDEELVVSYTGYEINAEDYFPSWEIPESHEIIQAGIEAFEAVFGKKAVVSKWDFCTNATSLCAKTGVPALGFGPGDSSLCHSTEDKVNVDEYLAASKFFALVALTASEK